MIFSENMSSRKQMNTSPLLKDKKHMEDMPTVGSVKGVYGAQNGMATQFPKKSTYMNAIAISIGKDHLCRECKTPTDYRETGWSNGAPVMQYICPHCGVEYHPVVIEL